MKFKKIFVSLALGVLLLSSCGNQGGSQPTPPGPVPPTPPEPGTVLVESITLGATKKDLALKSRFKITTTVLPSNATNKKLSWSVDNSEICTVDSNGYVYGAKEGTAYVTASATDGSGVSSTCEISVYKNKVTSVELSKHKLEMHKDDTEDITYSINPKDASIKDVTITSSDEDVASIIYKNNTITITAGKSGTSNVTVTSKDDPNISDTCVVNVTDVKVSGVSFRKQRLHVNLGNTASVQAIITPSNATNKNVAFKSNKEEIAKVNSTTGALELISAGTATITATTEDGGYTASIDVVVYPKDQKIKTTLSYTAKDVQDNNLINVDACPSTGTPKILIVPVWFNDSFYFISDTAQVRSDIEKAYLGTNSEVGWRSVSTYYNELSRNTLSLQGEVTEWYNTGMSYKEFMSDTSGATNTNKLVNDIVIWYKNTKKDDMSSFDTDHNGYIDGIILIYGAPDYIAMGKGDYSYTSDYSNLWAYCYWITANKKNLSSPNANVFFWASYDFMYSSGSYAKSRTGKSEYGNGDTRYQTIDTHTYIHEMGHVLGLNDYYDYSYQYSPAGGFSMQDSNVGSHDPYSAMSLGYVDPYVVSDTEIITIGSYQETGDIIVISDSFTDSPFDEYFLLELYTPTGLNEFDCLHRYDETYPLGPNSVGIRMWHVDARLTYATSSSSYYMDKNNITTNPWISGYKTDYLMFNSFVSSMEYFAEYTEYMTLQLIRNNKTVTYKSEKAITTNDLFYTGDKFDMYDYYNQFVNKSTYSSKKGALDSGKEFPFSIQVVSLNNDTATISIIKK